MTTNVALPSPQRDAEIANLIETLHATEQRLSTEADKRAAILNALPAHVALLDSQGVIVTVNDSWRRFGDANHLCDPDYCVGRVYADACTHAGVPGSADAGRVAEGVRSVLCGESASFSIEYSCHAPTQQRWFLMTVTPMEAGRLSGVIVMHVDVSARARAESQSRRTAELLNAVADSTPDLLYVKDVQGRYLFCNQALADFAGRPIEHIIGQDDTFLYPPAEANLLMNEDRRLFAAGLPQASEKTLTGARDSRTYHSTKAPYRNDQGLIGLIGIARDVSDRKRAEQEVLSSQALLHIAGRLARVGGWSVELPPTRVLWTDELSAMHEEPMGFSPTLEQALRYYVPEHLDLITAAFTRCVEHGTAYDVECEIITARGRRIWVRAVGEAVRDEQGVIRRVQGALQDLTDRKRAELQTARLATRLTNTLESITDAFFTLDREWRFTFLNGAAEKSMRYGRDELIGRVVWDLYPELIGTVFESGYRRAMGGERDVAFESMYEPWGAWIGVNCYPTDEGLSVNFRDVTVKRAERMQLELLECCVARMSDIVLITDASPPEAPRPRIVFVNDAFTRITGYAREEVLGRSPVLLNGPLTDPAELGRMRNALERTEPVHSELLNYRKDGTAYWVEKDIVPVNVSNDGRSHNVSIERDITERRRDQDALRDLNAELEARVAARTAELNLAREQADSANRAKSSFLATMSHEIRTPMNGVIGMIDVLEQGSLRADQADIVKTVRESAYALLKIVDDVLDFSKIEAGQFQIDREPMKPAAVVEGVCDALDPLAKPKGVALRMFTDPRLPSAALGDASRLRQVLLNLVGNAIKFSSGLPRAGRVSVRAMHAIDPDGQSMLEVRVVDNGIGMNAQTIERLFLPFTQADAGTTRQFGGTGLGLCISHRLVALMGGEIRVDSNAGAGSTFMVRVPLAPVPLAGTPEPADLDGLLCLVLGRADSIADDLAAYLTHAGASIERMAETSAVEARLKRNAGPCVVVIAQPDEPLELTLARCRAHRGPASVARLSFVVIENGRRRKPRKTAADVICLDGEAPHREVFLRAVALSSGRTAACESADAVSFLDRLTPAGAPAAAAERASPERLILVAEDNEINQKVLRKQLSLLGFAVEIAANGQDALELLRRGRYDLLLTDLHMPKMDGYALAAAVRDDEAGGPRIPIVALTANAMKGEARRCLDVGMDDYMTKPVQLTGLRAMLFKWLPATDAGAHDAAAIDREPSGIDNKDSRAPADLSVLEGLVGSDPTVIGEVLALFSAIASEAGAAIRQGIIEGPHTLVVDAAHKLKSNARSIGALTLGDTCAELEHAAGRGDGARLLALLPRFELESSALLRFLEGHTDAQGGPVAPRDSSPVPIEASTADGR